MHSVSASFNRDDAHTESMKRDLHASSDSPTMIKLIETPVCARPEKAHRSARPKSVRWREITVLRSEPTPLEDVSTEVSPGPGAEAETGAVARAMTR